MRTLKAFERGDGAKWGASDFYDETREALESALKEHKPFSTGWYGVKKQIETGLVYSLDGEVIVCKVSVSDDFDTEGMGHVEIRDWAASSTARSSPSTTA